MNSISVKDITRKFGKLVAVDKVSLQIKEGELFGLLGPNGAGKTTLLSMLSTTLYPTSGTAEVNGFDVVKNPSEVRKSIGMVFQDPSLDDELTAFENLDMHGAFYGMNKKIRREKINEVIELVDLKEKLSIIVKNYSGGMKRRLEIARGLMHMPKVLFLDEPTLGLDPQTRRHIWDYIKQLNRRGKITVILTTHYMEEADYLCDRIAIIDNGKIIAIGKSDDLKEIIGGDVISVKSGDNERLGKLLGEKSWAKKIVQQDAFVTVSTAGAEKKIPEIIKLAEKADIEIESVSLRKPTLEDVFLHYTGKTMRAEEGNSRDSVKAFMRMHGRRV